MRGIGNIASQHLPLQEVGTDLENPTPAHALSREHLVLSSQTPSLFAI